MNRSLGSAGSNAPLSARSRNRVECGLRAGPLWGANVFDRIIRPPGATSPPQVRRQSRRVSGGTKRNRLCTITSCAGLRSGKRSTVATRGVKSRPWRTAKSRHNASGVSQRSTTAKRARDILMLMGLVFAMSIVLLLRFIQPERLLRVESMPEVTDFFATLQSPLTPLFLLAAIAVGLLALVSIPR